MCGIFSAFKFFLSKYENSIANVFFLFFFDVSRQIKRCL